MASDPGTTRSDAMPGLLDPSRLAAVRSTGLLGSAAADSWDSLTGLAARLLDAPLAFMTVVDDRHSYWLSCSSVELAGDADRAKPVEESFCQYVIADRAPFAVEDAAAHPRTRGNPAVRQLGVRAWAGCPVLDAQGTVLGSFCVMDTVPRAWSPEQTEMLATLAAAASAQVQLLAALAAERRADERLQRLAAVAFELVSATTLDDLTDIVVNGALPVLGADGGAVVVVEDDGSMRLGISDALGEQTRVAYGRLAADDPLPACHVARTGERLQLPTQRSGLDFTPEMAAVYATTQRNAWVFTPLVVDGACLGSLAVSWPEERDFDARELDLIDAFAAQCAQALQRIRASEARQDEARQVKRLAESLQQALLTPPPEPDQLHVVVRYRPAAHAAQVGGDWYDAFLQPDGAMMLVIGDVVGHDSGAAAEMGQLRGLVRALAYTADDATADSPATVLTRVERAARGLDVDALATVVLARVDRVPDEPVTGRRTLRWSNAGHLPPVLLLADGTTALLDRPADLLLGVDSGTARHDHTEDLPDGSTLVLFTDGLVERRGEDLDRGVDRLRDVLRDLAHVPLEALCDALLDRLGVDAGEDDVAVVAVRAHPEDRPRPVEAGPRRL